MSHKPFFEEHPGLGAMFDYNRNGKVDLPEAIGMGGVAHAYAHEMLRATKEAEAEIKAREEERRVARSYDDEDLEEDVSYDLDDDFYDNTPSPFDDPAWADEDD